MNLNIEEMKILAINLNDIFEKQGRNLLASVFKERFLKISNHETFVAYQVTKDDYSVRLVLVNPPTIH